jgi:hypothetical protein
MTEIKIYTSNTYNSWMILSKLTTAKRRDAIAAAEMSERATIRSSDAVFATVAGDKSEGKSYAVFIALRFLSQTRSVSC